MLINFKILWCEDDKTWRDETQAMVENHLENLGFNAEFVFIDSADSASPALLQSSEYDLILTDLGFHNTNFGLEIIQKLRSNQLYTDVLFYSSKGTAELLAAMKEDHLDGVFISNRTDFESKFDKLVKCILRKTLHPKIMRGIIIGALSEIDGATYNILKKKYELSGDQKNEYVNDLKKSLCDLHKDRTKKARKILKEDNDQFIESIESTQVLESRKRLDKIIKFSKNDLATDDEHHANLSKLPDVSNKRNKLTHWKKIEANDEQIILKDYLRDESYTFNHSEAADLRKNINNGFKALNHYFNKINS